MPQMLFSEEFLASLQTLLCDINAMTSDTPNWTVEDKLALESQLLLHTSEPLCLDPSPGVFLASARLNYEKHKLNTTAFRRLDELLHSVNKRVCVKLTIVPNVPLHWFSPLREVFHDIAQVQPTTVGLPCHCIGSAHHGGSPVSLHRFRPPQAWSPVALHRSSPPRRGHSCHVD